MKTILNGDPAKSTTTINATTMSAHVVRHTKQSETDSVRTVCDWTLDFSNCTDAEMITLAVRSAVIAQQARMRHDGLTDGNTSGTIDVHALIQPRERGSVDPVAAANRARTLMTDEQKREQIQLMELELGVADTMHNSVSS